MKKKEKHYKILFIFFVFYTNLMDLMCDIVPYFNSRNFLYLEMSHS